MNTRKSSKPQPSTNQNGGIFHFASESTIYNIIPWNWLPHNNQSFLNCAIIGQWQLPVRHEYECHATERNPMPRLPIFSFTFLNCNCNYFSIHLLQLTHQPMHSLIANEAVVLVTSLSTHRECPIQQACLAEHHWQRLLPSHHRKQIPMT